jgi:predicted outer membrane repeat protein
MDISKSFLKKLLTSIVFIATSGFATVTVDGYAYLENQSDHSGVIITFERTAPSALTETTTTDATGLFTAQLETGIYDVTYTIDGYFYQSLTDQSFYANTTLSSLTLLEHTTLINVPSLSSTIQGAIDVAWEGDTILVQPGTYIENINYNGKNIVVGSLYLTTTDTSFISQTIIDGNQTGTVVTFINGEDSTAVLSGFTIQNGYVGAGLYSEGGGIYCNYSSPTLTNVTISGNSADDGGGICCNYSSPILTNVTISGNSADLGGGIFSSSSSPTMTNVTISGNSTGTSGGGIYCQSYSSPTMTNVTISGNSAGYRGGGIFCTNRSEPTMTNVTISGNTASYDGGGIYCNYSSPILTNVTISGNTASDDGGGFYCQSLSPTLTNVTISGNSAGNGGGIFSSSSPTLTNVTISGNTAGNGGGIYLGSGSPTITNSIISHNTGNYEIYVESGNPSITYSDFYNNQNGNFYNIGNYVGVNVTTNVNGDSCDAYNNIQLDPEFVDINNNNYRLQNWSQLIGAGTITDNMPDTDMDGNPRPNPEGANPDIGAYENPYGVPQYQPQVLNVPAIYSSIQAALTAANATDTVLVQPGTYEENIIWPETNGIKLISAGDSSNTIIDGGGVSSVIYMNPQTATIDTTTLIQGFKITNGGNVSSGSGLYLFNSGLTLKNASFVNNNNISTSNTGTGGGGIFVISSTLIIHAVIIIDNFAKYGAGMYGDNSDIYAEELFVSTNGSSDSPSSGGGACINNSNVFFSNFTFINNFASDNGGLLLKNCAISLINGEITNNTASNSGGIKFHNSTGTITSTKVSNNSASGNHGGGIYLRRSAVNMSDLIVENNFANIGGGGIYIRADRSDGLIPSLVNSKIINNSSNYGGGIFISDISNNPAIGGNIFFENYADYGGAISIDNSNLNLNDNGFYNNNALQGSAIHLYQSSTAEMSLLTIIKNIDAIESAIYVEAGNLFTIHDSNIHNNGVGIQNDDNQNFINAINNYWGHSSGPYHPTQNSSGQGDSVNTSVNVDPWVTAPNTDAPPIPAQNTTVTGTGNDFISLNWDASLIGDLAGYKLYYDSDTSGYPYANSVDIGTDTSYTLSSLTLGTTYYLAVTTYDTDGNESWYSNEVSGVTRIMQAQSLDIGGNEDLQHMVSHTPSITFNYYDSMDETQTSYQVQVSTDSTFSSANMWDPGSVSSDTTSVIYAGTALVDGTTYFLRVRVASGDFWSDWSTLSYRMNTEPTTPVLVSPINDQVTATPVVLNVFNAIDAESDVVTYSFNVYDEATLTTKLDSATALTEGTDTTSWQVTATLPDNGQYFWTVSTNDGYEESAVSDAGSFLLNTDNNPPDMFTLSMPLVDTAVQSLSPVFSWHPANDPDPIDTVHYTLMLDTPNPGVVVFEVGTDTSFQVPDPLMDNTQYYWQVIAEDLLGFQTINEGGYQTFYTNVSNDPPSVVTLITPTDNSIEIDLTPIFYWTESSDPDPMDHISYTMHWWPMGMLPVIYSANTDSNSFTPEENLTDNSQFGWMVTANDMHGAESNSDSSYFYTDAFPEPPLNFATVSPENNAEGIATEVEFAWNETHDPDPVEEIHYQLVYATDWADSSTYVFSELIQDTSLTVTLANNSQYYWIVVAMDTDGFMVGSDNNTPMTVVVGTLSIDGADIPEVFALHQNYPNPFNPTTQIKYDLPEDALVSITIYDIMGRNIKSLVNSNQSAGYRSIQWNATNNLGEPVSAGMYIYMIQAGEFRQTKKMVLLK